MSYENNLKRKISMMLGSGVLATSLAVVPMAVDFTNIELGPASAWAKGGGEGGGGSDGSSGDSDSSGDSGNSGSGSGSGNSGSSSGSGNSGSSSGSGSSGSSSGSGSSGSSSSNSGESAGSRNSGEHGRNRRGRGKGRNRGKGNNISIPGRFGKVISSTIKGRHVEVFYSDGWKESIKGGSYRLKNPRNKTIVERPARKSDFGRISRAIRNAIKN